MPLPTTTIRVLDRQQRQGEMSATTPVPADVQTVEVKGDMTTADKTDPGNSIICDVYVSPDGINWTLVPAGPARHLSRFSWQGGSHVDKFTGQTVPNELHFGFGPVDPYAGWTARVVVSIPVSMGFGCEVILNPGPRV